MLEQSGVQPDGIDLIQLVWEGPQMNLRRSIAVLSIFLIASAHSASAAEFTASFKWCLASSPVFTLSGVPKGTKTISLYMNDHNASFQHGGGDVSYTGKNTIPCGAIASGWIGPSPPGSEVHTYEFSIKAIDAGGNTLASTNAVRNYPE